MTRRAASLAVAMVLSASACTGSDASEVVTLYTSVTQGTVDAVVAGYEASHPGVRIEVFRAPTGELNARIATELREGGLRADVLWLTDPLSMQQFDAAGLLLPAEPDVSGIPVEHREERFWGTRLLDLVIVRNAAASRPVDDWDDLIDMAGSDGVALPDPAFAGSAFAALAFFASSPDHGMAFLTQLADAGATVLGAPGEVVTGVAEGQFGAGITLGFSARAAARDGSPIEIVTPPGGAITFYSPIAVTGDEGPSTEFVSYVLGMEAQALIAGTGWQPANPRVPWADAGPQATIDWTHAFDRQDELLDAFRAAFGG